VGSGQWLEIDEIRAYEAAPLALTTEMLSCNTSDTRNAPSLVNSLSILTSLSSDATFTAY
jgi:hypothetical protein